MTAPHRARYFAVVSRKVLDVVTGVFRNTNARNFAAVMDSYGEDVTLVLHGDFVGASGQEVVNHFEQAGR